MTTKRDHLIKPETVTVAAIEKGYRSRPMPVLSFIAFKP
jgi:hypothetical protein